MRCADTLRGRADEGHPPGTLAARTRAALARFALMRRWCGPRMRIRVYDEFPTVSVVRGDDSELVTPYVRFFIGSNSLTFEFRSGQAPRMFTKSVRAGFTLPRQHGDG
jgi:hypothetical protein